MIVTKRIYFIFLFIGLWCFSAQAQDTLEIASLKAPDLKKLGNAAIQQGDYFLASEYFSQFLKFKPNNGKIAYKLATCYRMTRDYVNAQDWYDKAYKFSANPLALYYYGLMLKTNGDCDKAKLQFAKFRK